MEYETAFQVLNQAVLKERYDSVIMLGLAAVRKVINIEHHASIADEAGVFKQFEKFRDQGPMLVESMVLKIGYVAQFATYSAQSRKPLL